MSSINLKALLALVALVFIWAYSWIIMKQVLAHIDPFDFAALRYLGGALVLFLILLLQRQSLAPPPFWPTLLIGLMQTTAFQALAQWALVDGGAGKVSLFCYTMPFWTVLLAWWWLQEKPGGRQWLGIAFAATGLCFVIAPWQGLSDLNSVLLAIIGGIAWAIGTVATKVLFQRHQVSPIRLTAWQMLLGALILCLIAWQVPSRPIEWNGQFIWQLSYSVVLASSLAWVLWSIIVRLLPTSLAGISSLLVPICAILLGWWLLNEVPSGTELVGITLVVIGLIVIRPRAQKIERMVTPVEP